MDYELLMKECINLARQAEGNVSPNPLVGAIVLDKSNNIISKGYHIKYGEYHAERNALINIDKSKTRGGTVIVNLEPCCHHGKTPPCTDIIMEKGISRVVIGMRDVNPLVSGKGIKILKDAGIEVIENVLNTECKQLNEVFIKNMLEKKAFVAIKTATTLDGKIATSNGSSKWITSAKARDEVKNIRNRYDAILTSSATILADNPTMSHRKKIIIDRELKTSLSSNIYQDGEIFVYYNQNISDSAIKSFLTDINSHKLVKLCPAPLIDDKIDLEYVLSDAFKNGIMSVLVEAGGKLNGNILKYTDKIYQFIAPKILGDNAARSCFDYRNIDDINSAVNFYIENTKFFNPDIMLTLYPTKK